MLKSWFFKGYVQYKGLTNLVFPSLGLWSRVKGTLVKLVDICSVEVPLGKVYVGSFLASIRRCP